MAKFDMVVSYVKHLSPRVPCGGKIVGVAGILNSSNLFNASILVARRLLTESKIWIEPQDNMEVLLCTDGKLHIGSQT
jgi:hypothetical protein